ncbi:hypothetical protein [Gordonia phthalatica]|uniref:Uncharacterized protein n=1 Tax=Gordonia phthalatica TaxID=1136941 RepID=A0A0N9NAB1_9ACTN|nr:hypothetical protein [Gordonia phthalatica]ALG84299.1 hypothetical protein ACH46_07025 [Gordonia phthalatica]
MAIASPVSAVGPLAQTGVGATASIGALATTVDGWTAAALGAVFILLAAFTLFGAAGALARTLPMPGFRYRTPKLLAPSDDEYLALVGGA